MRSRIQKGQRRVLSIPIFRDLGNNEENYCRQCLENADDRVVSKEESPEFYSEFIGRRGNKFIFWGEISGGTNVRYEGDVENYGHLNLEKGDLIVSETNGQSARKIDETNYTEADRAYCKRIAKKRGKNPRKYGGNMISILRIATDSVGKWD